MQVTVELIVSAGSLRKRPGRSVNSSPRSSRNDIKHPAFLCTQILLPSLLEGGGKPDRTP
jgi:hypothetical protein